MTRDADQRPTNPRRQRPLLVISSGGGSAADQQRDQSSEGGTQQAPAHEGEQASSSPAARASGSTGGSGARRQPGFFASVTQSAREQEPPERQRLQTDAGKMRLWRALRLRRGQSTEGEAASAERAGKTVSGTEARGQAQKVLRNSKKAQPTQETAPAARGSTARSGGQTTAGSSAQASRPLLKSRHFVGLFIYIFAATLLQIPLAYLSQTFHLERVLLQFSIFNFPVVITQALVIYLVLLVALLLLLNRFDLLPSFSRPAEARRGGAAQGSGSRSKAGSSGKGKGVTKGEHDHLYEDYRDLRRYLRRRARKR
ncbi:hypothetical protein [Thermogemmatispora sp.]|uniref:hypothetical protein n=1 Tax=Thermogemmatispora sp. TaxID=1968838 RepID=UPI0035E40D40